MKLSVQKEMHFHNEIKWILVLAQSFGLMPVHGITRKNPDKVIFKLISKRTFWAIIILTISGFLTVMTIIRIASDGIKLYRISNFIFTANGFLTGLALMRLASDWPELITYWTRIEIILENSKQTRTKLKINRIVSIILLAATVEHLLSIYNGYKLIHENNKAEEYFRTNFQHFFSYFNYSVPLAIFAVFSNILQVFSWNFLDAFLIVLSIGLSEQFVEIGKKIESGCKMRIESKLFWSRLREDYNNVTLLCRKVDEKISSLILISYGTNTYFIVSQLYSSLNSRTTFLQSLYYVFSFGLLLSRTVAVTIYAAKINDGSRIPIKFLLSLSPQSYNSEVERLIVQIRCEPISLTGSGFFTITRGLLFSMAGSIVTYELFLIQSNVNLSY